MEENFIDSKDKVTSEIIVKENKIMLIKFFFNFLNIFNPADKIKKATQA